MKVVSLVPSITEALLDLGVPATAIVGRTKFCVHPENLVHNIEKIGGTKTVNIQKIKDLKPDLVIANKEENVKEQIEEIRQFTKVMLTDISTIEDNYYLLKRLGNLFNCPERAQLFNLKIYDVFQEAKVPSKVKVAYLIWRDPYMTIGRDTFIHHVLEELGFENVFRNQKRYPIVEISDLKDADVVFLSSEPFPFKDQHQEEIEFLLKNKKVIKVDGEAFSWYGTHLAKCGNYFKNLVSEF